MLTLSTRRLAFAQAIVLAFASISAAEIPAGYYDAATGTGSTLKLQLATIMSTGHILRTYGNFRDSAAITDRDPNNPNNILLVYNRASVPATWDQGNTWNREHTWPQSRQPGSASNGTTGNLGDPHALRPANPGINSDRGNDPFGTVSSSGSHGSVGSFYFPGDADKGDTARQLFYSATRYSGLSLVNGFPGSNQMGDLAALLDWHYSDGPDAFERNRNDAIYSQALNPSFYTNNRNAFIDRPEFVWSVFVDQQNDTQLTLSGGSAEADGSSSRSIDLGRKYAGVGGAPSSALITVNKAGSDGTYYQVSTTGDAFTDAGDNSRPFAMGGSGSDSISVGLSGLPSSSGEYTGSVIIDNLDVTTGGGTGHGANDGDDVVDLTYSILDQPVASFAEDSILDMATIDFGQINVGSGLILEEFDFFNYDGLGGPSFASDLDFDSLSSVGDDSILSLDAMLTSGIAQGDGHGFDASFDTSLPGLFEATYTFNLSGEDLAGEQTQTLSLTLLGEVVATLAGDYNDDGTVNAADYTVYRDTLGSTADLRADGNDDGTVNAADLTVWQDAFGSSLASTSNAVPEPTSLLLTMVAYGYFSTVARRR